jgi:membrane protein YqaA with SNARE-associated domain
MKNNKFTGIIRQRIIASKYFYYFLFLLSLALLLFPLFLDINTERFIALGLLGIFIFNLIDAATIIPAPAIISVGLGGYIYNPFAVAFIAAAGSTLGEVIAYLLGYSTDKAFNLKRFKVLYKKLKYYLTKYGVYVIFLLAFIPNPFFGILGIYAGVAQYPLRKFFLIIFIARLIRDIIIANVGALVQLG